jgi:diguanylate cyclase (GGDEF)-like protein
VATAPADARMLSNSLPSQPPAIPRLLWIGTLTSIAILALFSTVAWRMAADDYARARQAAGNLVGPAAMDIGRMIETYDLSLSAIVEGIPNARIAALPDDLRRLVLFDRSATKRDLGPVFVLDAGGTVVLEARPGSVGESSHWGRDYFLVHQQNRGPALYVSRPWMSASGGYAIAISRRIIGADGTFLGVAVGTLHLSYFQYILGKLTVSPSDALAIAHTDGTLIMRLPFEADFVGRDVSNSQLFRQILAANFSGAFDAVASLDGQSRLYAFQRIGNLPLVLTYGVHLQEVYRDWWRQTIILGLIVVLLCVINLALLVFLTRELRRRAAVEETLAGLAITDSLTGLGNRRKFDEELDREWQRAHRTGEPIALLVIDADSFKSFNDRYGHLAGDAALRQIAGCMTRAARRPLDVNARYGGEEFVSLLPQQSLSGALHVANRLREEIQALRSSQSNFDNRPPVPTVSIGVAAFDACNGSAQDLISSADEALYRAKTNGRDRVEWNSVSGNRSLAA